MGMQMVCQGDPVRSAGTVSLLRSGVSSDRYKRLADINYCRVFSSCCSWATTGVGARTGDRRRS